MIRNFVVLLTVISLLGCTTLQPLADAQPATIQQSVKVGDTVEIERTDGTHQTLKVDAVRGNALAGTHAGKRYQVPLGEIRSIGTREMSSSAKTWTIVGIIAAVGALIAGAGGGSSGGGGGY